MVGGIQHNIRPRHHQTSVLGGSQKHFYRGPTVVNLRFINSKLRKKQFSIKKLIGKYPITKSHPSSDAHEGGQFLRLQLL